MEDPLIGMTVGSGRDAYELLGRLREGGMGAVYLARRGGAVDDHAVVKVALSDDHQLNSRFDVEIRAIRSLDHPGVIGIMDDGEVLGRRWYAMPHVGAYNLAEILACCGGSAPDSLLDVLHDVDQGALVVVPGPERRGLAAAEALALMTRVSKAVGHAHGRGVLHRDLKPANILLDDSAEPVLCDFGVARDRNHALHLTAADEVVGTLAYVSPDQLDGGPVDERADVYALGVMFHECLTGQLPPQVRHHYDPLKLLAPIDEKIRRVVRKALHPDPQFRYVDAGQLAADCDRLRQGEEPLAPRLPRLPVVWQSLRRHPLRVALICAVVVIGLILWRYQSITVVRETVTWGQASEVFDLRDGEAGDLETFAGTWVHRPGFGWTAMGRPQEHHDVLGFRVPIGPGIRFSVEVVAPQEIQEVGCFIAGRDDWSDGYIFQLGAYQNSCAILRRGSEVLWMGEGQVEPNRRYLLELERVLDQVTVRLDGVELVSVHDNRPVEGEMVGVVTYPVTEGAAGPTYARITTLVPELPRLLPASWPLERLALATRAAEGERRQNLLQRGVVHGEGLRTRIPDGDPRLSDVLLVLGELLVEQGDPAALARHSDDLAGFDESVLSDPDYHIQRLAIADGQSADVDEQGPGLIDRAAFFLDDEGFRRFACWVDVNGARRFIAGRLPRVLRHLPQEDPLAHYLSSRTAWEMDYILLDRDAAAARYRLLAGRGWNSWWRGNARARLDLFRYQEAILQRDEETIRDVQEDIMQAEGSQSAFVNYYLARQLFDIPGKAPQIESSPYRVFERNAARNVLRGRDLQSLQPFDNRSAQTQALRQEFEQGGAPELLQVINHIDPPEWAAGMEALRWGRLVVVPSDPALRRGVRIPIRDELMARQAAALMVSFPDDPRLEHATGLLGGAGPGRFQALVALMRRYGIPIREPKRYISAATKGAWDPRGVPMSQFPPLPLDNPLSAMLELEACARLSDAEERLVRLQRVADLPATWPETIVARRLLEGTLP